MKKNKNQDIFSPENIKCKHVSLTHWLRREFVPRPAMIKNTIKKCVVAEYIGSLPKELRDRKRKEQLSDYTRFFVKIINRFLKENFYDLLYSKEDIYYNFKEMGRLFYTDCFLEIKGSRSKNSRRGGFGFVGKLSFPELKTAYALKIFYEDMEIARHGAFYEVATAFNAGKAEPKSNNKVHLASFSKFPYMLSDWAGEETPIYLNENKYKIFDMKPIEIVARNFRCGKRIDFGDTYRTTYGAASYRVRKMFRKIVFASENEYTDELNKIFYSNYNYLDKKVLKEAAWLAFLYCSYNSSLSNIEKFFQNINNER